VSQVSIIIPNWNGRHLLDACLAALGAQTWLDYEIIVVDNGSRDGSVAWLRSRYPQIRVIANGRNLGFAAAVNQGVKASDSRYVVTLNNDTEPDPAWLAALVSVAEEDPTVGMCASKMLFADRPGIINSTGICIDQAGIAWDRRGGESDDDSEMSPVEVFGPCGGAAMYRRAMLDKIGLFDEDFFAYLEDVDLAWRARRAGQRCLYVPTARVFHRHSATGGEGSPFKNYHVGRNKIGLIARNYPFVRLWRCVPALVLYDMASVAYMMLVRHDIHALYGRLAGLVRLGRMWRKRETTDGAIRTDLAYLAQLQPLWRVPRRYAHLAPSSGHHHV
jgi:GT2 family glycosyltransferase